jgi:hypothetical protein
MMDRSSTVRGPESRTRFTWAAKLFAACFLPIAFIYIGRALSLLLNSLGYDTHSPMPGLNEITELEWIAEVWLLPSLNGLMAGAATAALYVIMFPRANDRAVAKLTLTVWLPIFVAWFLMTYGAAPLFGYSRFKETLPSWACVPIATGIGWGLTIRYLRRHLLGSFEDELRN